MLIKYQGKEHVFQNQFRVHHGGMPRYRGSLMAGGSFWGKILGFARGLFSKAAPHLSSLVAQAQPMVKKAASRMAESAIDSSANYITQKIQNAAQTGNGIKRRKRKRAKVTSSRKRSRSSRSKRKRLKEPELKGSLL